MKFIIPRLINEKRSFSHKATRQVCGMEHKRGRKRNKASHDSHVSLSQHHHKLSSDEKSESVVCVIRDQVAIGESRMLLSSYPLESYPDISTRNLSRRDAKGSLDNINWGSCDSPSIFPIEDRDLIHGPPLFQFLRGGK